jgi:hypothetical protein
MIVSGGWPNPSDLPFLWLVAYSDELSSRAVNLATVLASALEFGLVHDQRIQIDLPAVPNL